MKGQWKGFASGVLLTLLVCFAAVPAFAQTGKVMQELEYRNIKVTLDGEQLDLCNAIGEPVEPFMFGGTNYLPVRALAEALGLNVSWDGANSTVVLKTPQTPQPVQKDTYSIGDTWTVPGQWELTVTGVTKVTERNQFSDKNPVAVYRIDYTYKNIGYEDKDGFFDGLFLSLDVCSTIVDAAASMVYTYPGDTTYSPQETPVGASCKAQAVFGVDHEGPFTIRFSDYDGNNVSQKATFALSAQ